MIKKELIKIGLSEKEAAVYLASIEIGEAQAPKIASQAGIQRPITYFVLENLNKMGLISMVDKKGKTYYIAESPSNLKRLVEKEKSVIDQKEQIVREVMPGLEKIFSMMGDRPVVRFFEGVEGIKTIQEDMINNKSKEILEIISLDALFKIFPEQKNVVTNINRVKKGIKSRVIYTYSEGELKEMNSRKMLKEVHFVPQNKFNLNGDITIYNDKVSITSLSGRTPVSVLIEERGIANFLRDVFELAWIGSK
ncbi:hypothetical protein ISS03_01690 [Patescibacteria group bacterium]|nr:hypothetical protein [Patescibacteria group bacterium]